MRKLILVTQPSNLSARVLSLTRPVGFFSDAAYSSEIHACWPVAAGGLGRGGGVFRARIC